MSPLMDRTPLFSIITITFNAESTITPTLDSVDSQTCTDYEHIIVDGASTDSTLDITDTYAAPCRDVYSEPDEGLYDAMNKGIGFSQGKYLIFMNAGDRFHDRDTLQRIKELIVSNDYPGIVYGQTNIVDAEGRFLAPRHLTAPENLTLKDFAHGMMVCHQSFVVLKRIAPLYNVGWRYSADYEWCIRCLMHSRHNVYYDGVIADYLSEGVTTANRKASLKERFKIMSTYYGFWPTLMRHLGFIKRYFNHKKELKNASI